MAKAAAIKLPAAGERAGFYDAKTENRAVLFQQKSCRKCNSLNLAIMAGSKSVMDSGGGF